MRLSIEATVAAAVAACFALLSICAIAQEQGQHATGGSSGAMTQVSLPVSGGSVSDLVGGDTEALGAY